MLSGVLEHARDISLILGTIVAGITLLKAFVEYLQQNAQRRAEHYLKLHEQFKA